jgi:hypothetical protein
MTYRMIASIPSMFPGTLCIACGEDDTYHNGQCSYCGYAGG